MRLLISCLCVLCMLRAAAQVEATGRFIEVGRHRLFMLGNGMVKGHVTVVFESGGGGTSNDWAKVMALLPANTQVVAYDRAGLGKSGKGPLPRTMAQEVLELHELLLKAGVKGKIILVGQSIGGLNARLYTQQYPKQVAGMVLVDPTDESAVLGSLRYGGWTRLREKATGKPIPIPQLKDSISTGFDSTADYMAEEFQQVCLYRQQHAQALGHRPLVVISAGIRNQPPGTPNDQWKVLKEERDAQVKAQAGLSSNGQFMLAEHSMHQVQNDEPAVVARAIKAVMDAVKNHKPITLQRVIY